MPENQQPESGKNDSTPKIVSTVCALGFNVFGIVALSFGSMPITGNVPAAEAILTNSLTCLSVSLFHSAKGHQQKRKN